MGSAAGLIAVIVHQDDNHLGRFEPLLKRRADVVEKLRADDLDLDDDSISGIVSLGGDMCALDDDSHPVLRREVEVLREAHERRIPVLGICLGGQLLARALGGSVERNGGRELGWIDVNVLEDDPLLGPAGVSPRLLWHSDAFTAPPGATVLGTGGPTCPDQAFRVGHSYGFQFHPEATLAQVRSWIESESGAAELAEAGVDGEYLMEESRRLEPVAEEGATTIVNGFLDLCVGAPAD